jgi:hypothetical protein
VLGGRLGACLRKGRDVLFALVLVVVVGLSVLA